MPTGCELLDVQVGDLVKVIAASDAWVPGDIVEVVTTSDSARGYPNAMVCTLLVRGGAGSQYNVGQSGLRLSRLTTVVSTYARSDQARDERLKAEKHMKEAQECEKRARLLEKYGSREEEATYCILDAVFKTRKLSLSEIRSLEAGVYPKEVLDAVSSVLKTGFNMTFVQ